MLPLHDALPIYRRSARPATVAAETAGLTSEGQAQRAAEGHPDADPGRDVVQRDPDAHADHHPEDDPRDGGPLAWSGRRLLVLLGHADRVCRWPGRADPPWE